MNWESGLGDFDDLFWIYFRIYSSCLTRLTAQGYKAVHGGAIPGLMDGGNTQGGNRPARGRL